MTSLHNIIKNKIHLPVAVACSAGVDSMVLMNLLYETGLLEAVLHCQFGLRAEAFLEEEYLKKWTSNKNIPFYVKHFDTQSVAVENKVSIQMAARQLRYDWFAECAELLHVKIALAHHLDDFAETVFYNLFRNKDFHILQGIPYQRDFIVRPLLKTTKAEIKEFAINNDIQWIEDHSNLKNDYARNQIRNQILNQLTDIHQNPAKCLENRTTLYQKQMFVLDGFLEKEKENWLIEKENRYFISIPYFENLHSSEKEIYLRWFSDKYIQLTEKECNEWITHFYAKTGSKLPVKNIELIRDRNFWVVQDKPIPLEPIILSTGLNIWGDYQIEMSEVLCTHFTIKIPKHIVSGNLQLRIWEIKDWVTPRGFRGKQKVSDILTNMKFPSWLKSNAFVLIDDNQVFMTENFRPAEFPESEKSEYIYLNFKRIKNFY